LIVSGAEGLVPIEKNRWIAAKIVPGKRRLPQISQITQIQFNFHLWLNTVAGCWKPT